MKKPSAGLSAWLTATSTNVARLRPAPKSPLSPSAKTGVCQLQTATNQQDGTKDTLALPDARSGGVKIQQFHRGQVTTEIVADSVNNFETNDSTVAYVVDVDIFDSTGAVSSEVVGDSAVFREGQENLEIFGNVVVTNRDSIIVETEYLRWNPVNEKIEEFLKTNNLVHPDSSISDISSFLERQVSAGQGYPLLAVLKLESEKPTKKNNNSKAD